MDALVLLFHIHRGKAEATVGFEDAAHTIEQLTRKLDKSFFIEPSVLESCLWSANLMDEAGKFWSPSGESFEAFAKRLVAPDKFDRNYNFIRRKEK